MSARVGLLMAVAVLLAAPPGRRLRTEGRRGATGPPSRARRPDTDLSSVLLGVSAQLRAGATPAAAWSRMLGPAAGSVPTEDALVAATSRRGRLARLRRADDGGVQRVRAVVAAARLSNELGAPLAGVLDRIASAVAADEEAQGERRAALAGPRSSGQVLAWLPLLGVALGALLGADPVGVVLSGGLGTASAVVGLVLLLAGRWWTSALLTRAGRAGQGRAGPGFADR